MRDRKSVKRAKVEADKQGRYTELSLTVKELLGSIPFLCNAPAHVRHLLSASVVWKNYIMDDLIVKEGDPADSMFIFIHGTAKVVRGPERKVVMEFKPGSFFGENALWQQGQERHASVVATSDCTCIEIPRAVYHQCDPAAAEKWQQQQQQQMSRREQHAHVAAGIQWDNGAGAGSSQCARQAGVNMQEAGDFERLGSAGQLISTSMHQAAAWQTESPAVPNYMRAQERIASTAPARTASAKARRHVEAIRDSQLADSRPSTSGPSSSAGSQKHVAESNFKLNLSNVAPHPPAAPVAWGESNSSDVFTRAVSCPSNPVTVKTAQALYQNEPVPPQPSDFVGQRPNPRLRHVGGCGSKTTRDVSAGHKSGVPLRGVLASQASGFQPPANTPGQASAASTPGGLAGHAASARQDHLLSHPPSGRRTSGPADFQGDNSVWAFVNAALDQYENGEGNVMRQGAGGALGPSPEGAGGALGPSPAAHSTAFPPVHTPRTTASASRARHYFGNAGKGKADGEMEFRRVSSAGSRRDTRRLPALNRSFVMEQVDLRG